MIDMSHLNHFVQLTRFKMETNQSSLHAVRRDDWMFSINLKDAYLQVPIHPDSRRYLWFVADGQVHQFKTLCFYLSTVPQVFIHLGHRSCVSHPSQHGCPDTPVSGRLVGSRLVQSGGPVSKRKGSRPLSPAWHRCEPSQVTSYPLSLCLVSGDVSREPSLRAFPSQERVLTLRPQLAELLFYSRQGVVAWRSLLGRLSSLCLLIPGGRLQMHSLQLEICRQQDFLDESVGVPGLPRSTRTSCGGSTPTTYFRESLWRSNTRPALLV